MESKKQIWAVVTGSINSKLDFDCTIKTLVSLRSKDQISGIILSTWKKQLSDTLKELLIEQNVIIIENDEPLVDKGEQSTISIQEYQLYSALLKIPLSSIIIKCRTDYSTYWLVHENEFFLSDNFLNSSLKWKNGKLFHRLYSNYSYVPIIPPFRFGDQEYVGNCNDLFKLIPLKNSIYKKWNYASDDRFALIFFDIPIVKDAIESIDFSKLSFLKTKRDLEFPCILNKFYALYFVILYFCFYQKINNFNDYEIINTMDDVFLRQSEGFVLRKINWKHISTIVEGRLEKTPGYIKLLNEINKMKDCNYAYSCYYSDEDWQELLDWGKTNLNDESNNWINHNVSSLVPSTDQKCYELPYYLNKIYDMILAKKIIKCADIQFLKSINYSSYIDALRFLIRYDDFEAATLYINEFENYAGPQKIIFANNNTIIRFCQLHDCSYIFLRLVKQYPKGDQKHFLNEFFKLDIKIDDIDSIFSSLISNYLKLPAFSQSVQRCHLALVCHDNCELTANIHLQVESLVFSSLPKISKKGMNTLIEAINNDWVRWENHKDYWYSVFNDAGLISKYLSLLNNSGDFDKEVEYKVLTWELARNNNLDAQRTISKMFLKEGNDLMYEYWLKRLICNGDKKAAYELFDHYWSLNQPSFDNEMIDLIRPYVSSEDPIALHKMGIAYREGRGVEKDIKKSVEFLLLASNSRINWIRRDLLQTLWMIRSSEFLNILENKCIEYRDTNFQECSFYENEIEKNYKNDQQQKRAANSLRMKRKG